MLCVAVNKFINKNRAQYLSTEKRVAYRAWERLVSLELLCPIAGDQQAFRAHTLERTQWELDDALRWATQHLPTAVAEWATTRTPVY
jgi:hypothetical protein